MERLWEIISFKSITNDPTINNGCQYLLPTVNVLVRNTVRICYRPKGTLSW